MPRTQKPAKPPAKKPAPKPAQRPAPKPAPKPVPKAVKPLSLTSAQRKWLRGQAHALKPLVQVGKQGLAEPVLRQVDAALDVHELIKVQAAIPREEKDAMAERLAGELRAEVAGRIGHVIILFRQNPDPEKRVYDIPD